MDWVLLGGSASTCTRKVYWWIILGPTTNCSFWNIYSVALGEDGGGCYKKFIVIID